MVISTQYNGATKRWLPTISKAAISGAVASTIEHLKALHRLDSTQTQLEVQIGVPIRLVLDHGTEDLSDTKSSPIGSIDPVNSHFSRHTSINVPLNHIPKGLVPAVRELVLFVTMLLHW
jgi:hypothetical protein